MHCSAYLQHYLLLQHILGCYLNNVCPEPPRPVLLDIDENICKEIWPPTVLYLLLILEKKLGPNEQLE